MGQAFSDEERIILFYVLDEIGRNVFYTYLIPYRKKMNTMQLSN